MTSSFDHQTINRRTGGDENDRRHLIQPRGVCAALSNLLHNLPSFVGSFLVPSLGDEGNCRSIFLLRFFWGSPSGARGSLHLLGALLWRYALPAFFRRFRPGGSLSLFQSLIVRIGGCIREGEPHFRT